MVVARWQRQLLSVLAKVQSGVQLRPLQSAAALGPQFNRLRAVLLSKIRVIPCPEALLAIRWISSMADLTGAGDNVPPSWAWPPRPFWGRKKVDQADHGLTAVVKGRQALTTSTAVVVVAEVQNSGS
jgi:hypothetical protein